MLMFRYRFYYSMKYSFFRIGGEKKSVKGEVGG